MADRPLTNRQLAVLSWLERWAIARPRLVDPATWELAAVLGWNDTTTAAVLAQLRKRGLVEYGQRAADDAHYINRHKLSTAGVRAVDTLGKSGQLSTS